MRGIQISLFAAVLGVFLGSNFLGSPEAQAGSFFTSDRDQSLRSTLEKCLVRPYGIRSDGSIVSGAYQSICEGVDRNGLVATVWLAAGGRPEARYEIQLIGSEANESDQLWDVAVWDENSNLVLEARGVIAFGDPFEALARLIGAKPTLRIHDDQLDELH